MIKLKNFRNLLESLLELLNLSKRGEVQQGAYVYAQMFNTHLLEMISQLDDGRGLKHSLRVDDQLAVLK